MEQEEEEKEAKREWFVMRDLHRGHRAHLSYQLLAEKGYSTYTPTVKTIVSFGEILEKRYINLSEVMTVL